ncbi:hypothetical protein B0H14DRAFT_2854543 [Mycena olivaceomarginata]|nr:hypothetical protein B0H14DRAFT_2854543 [Mycena olivaceomarginata]
MLVPCRSLWVPVALTLVLLTTYTFNSVPCPSPPSETHSEPSSSSFSRLISFVLRTPETRIHGGRSRNAQGVDKRTIFATVCGLGGEHSWGWDEMRFQLSNAAGRRITQTRRTEAHHHDCLLCGSHR